ncbi:hypothetical protein J2Z21_007746 [Streptomyces griseochromogenes]|uniref:Uncharacterized protein n=1 Tax=Streptomyces griseochromogenes TaxID=68214 RepID=A0ABS4M5T5_9ACTN|nr:hypothetical protein [Streptomyces griseochromogenes]
MSPSAPTPEHHPRARHATREDALSRQVSAGQVRAGPPGPEGCDAPGGHAGDGRRRPRARRPPAYPPCAITPDRAGCPPGAGPAPGRGRPVGGREHRVLRPARTGPPEDPHRRSSKPSPAACGSWRRSACTSPSCRPGPYRPARNASARALPAHRRNPPAPTSSPPKPAGVSPTGSAWPPRPSPSSVSKPPLPRTAGSPTSSANSPCSHGRIPPPWRARTTGWGAETRATPKPRRAHLASSVRSSRRVSFRGFLTT